MSHIFGTLEGVKIERTEDLVTKMDHVVNELKLTEVSRCFHQFEPFGATGVILLAESHFSIHTYPEHYKLYFDLFLISLFHLCFFLTKKEVYNLYD
jgi:S-adenosylmethionine decarboxylase